MDRDLKTIIAPDVSPEKVCFWTGAGISVDKPSCLPVGDSLTKKAVEYFCLPGTWNKLIHYFKQAKMQDAFGYEKLAPRLEAVLESIMQAIGIKVLAILDPSLNAKPNRLHYLFAKHLEDGGTHITPNFDSCIENSLPSHSKVQIIENFESPEILSERFSKCLVHIHGRYDRGSTNLEHLGVRIRTIASGFPEWLGERITFLLRQQDYLIFIGYSGRDYFDVNPYFSEIGKRKQGLKNLTVIWVKHTMGEKEGKSVPFDKQEQGKVILDALGNCGARIVYLLMQTDKFLDIFQKIWGLSCRSNKPNDKRDDKQYRNLQEILQSRISISQDDKILVTTQLFSSMGIGREVVALKDDLLRVANEKLSDNSLKYRVYFLLNNGLRDVGLYKQSQKFSHLLPAFTLREKISFHERAAGDYWLRGDHFRAAWHFFRGIIIYGRKINKFEKADIENQSATDIYYESIITFLHWCRDIKKLPLVGRLFPLCLGIRAFQQLMEAREYLLKNPHAKAKLIRLYDEIPNIRGRTLLPSWIKSTEVEVISHFRETDSILGVVNFSRREIMRGLGEGKKPEKGKLELLYSCSELIGDRPGMLKAVMLQKKIYGLDNPRAKKTLKEVEWAWWKKIGWLLDGYWMI